MPSTYAHRRFGANVLEHLPGEFQAKIEPYRELYDIGLHGPDLLFYYDALRSNKINQLGNEMHEQPGETFFLSARKWIQNAENRDASLAYVLGFICHFALDSTCHPCVEQYVRSSGVSHCEIETEFDNMLMRRDGYDPLHYFTASHIHPSMENAKVVEPFYQGISTEEIYGAMKGMLTVHRLLQASNPVKRWVVLTGMRVVGKYDGMHGLVANPKPNPACAISSRKLDILYGKALPLAERLIREYIETLDSDRPLDKAYQHTFGEN